MRSNAMILLALAVAVAPVATSAQPAGQPASSHAILTTEGSGQSQAKPDFARLTATVAAKAQTLDKAVQAEQDLVAREFPAAVAHRRWPPDRKERFQPRQ